LRHVNKYNKLRTILIFWNCMYLRAVTCQPIIKVHFFGRGHFLDSILHRSVPRTYVTGAIRITLHLLYPWPRHFAHSTKLFSLIAVRCNYKSFHPVRYNSSLSSSISHGVGPLVDPFRSHVSRNLFKVLPRFLLPVGQYCFITLGNLLRGILFTCCIQFLLYSSNLSKIEVIFNSFAIYVFVL
jgi:hypothetical protein